MRVPRRLGLYQLGSNDPGTALQPRAATPSSKPYQSLISTCRWSLFPRAAGIGVRHLYRITICGSKTDAYDFSAPRRCLTRCSTTWPTWHDRGAPGSRPKTATAIFSARTQRVRCRFVQFHQALDASASRFCRPVKEQGENANRGSVTVPACRKGSELPQAIITNGIRRV